MPSRVKVLPVFVQDESLVFPPIINIVKVIPVGTVGLVEILHV